MAHSPDHLLMGVAVLAATLLLYHFSRNRLVRRKLRLSLYLTGAYIFANVILPLNSQVTATPDLPAQLEQQFRSLEQLALAAAVINLLVVALINPLRVDRVPDAFPSILQDAIVIAILVLVATFVFEDRLLTTSAIGAVVVGFALQDTLGNAFAGLAIQSEKPFSVGNWVKVGDLEGRVTEVTWRATRLRTRAGNFIVVPNNRVSQEPIVNYSEPGLPTRLEVEVGASYQNTPAQVKAAIMEAFGHAPRVLEVPPPDVLLLSFDDSAVIYRARFWIDDFEWDDEARDEVRTAIFYAFARRGIEIPYPIEVGYEREWPEPDPVAKQKAREEILARVDLFSRLSDEQRRAFAEATEVRRYGDGEAIVRQGEPGDSMFVVTSGRVAVCVEPGRREIAVIEAGGYFGEMSVLSGEPRSATVVSRGDADVLELDASLFRSLAAADPQAVEDIGLAAVARRAELNQALEAAASTAVTALPATFLSKMRAFLRLTRS